MPCITQSQEWQHVVRNNCGSASGHPAKAFAFLCIAEQPTTSYDDLQDSGDFESIDCKLAAGLTAVFNPLLLRSGTA
eukprot:1939999-Pyramimonas_sp.AAC.1